MRPVARQTAFADAGRAHRLMLEDEWSSLVRVASHARIREVLVITEQRGLAPLVNVVAVRAAHAVLEHRMVRALAELCRDGVVAI